MLKKKRRVGKKLVSIVLVLSLLFSMMNTAVFAAVLPDAVADDSAVEKEMAANENSEEQPEAVQTEETDFTADGDSEEQLKEEPVTAPAKVPAARLVKAVEGQPVAQNDGFYGPAKIHYLWANVSQGEYIGTQTVEEKYKEKFSVKMEIQPDMNFEYCVNFGKDNKNEIAIEQPDSEHEYWETQVFYTPCIKVKHIYETKNTVTGETTRVSSDEHLHGHFGDVVGIEPKTTYKGKDYNFTDAGINSENKELLWYNGKENITVTLPAKSSDLNATPKITLHYTRLITPEPPKVEKYTVIYKDGDAMMEWYPDRAKGSDTPICSEKSLAKAEENHPNEEFAGWSPEWKKTVDGDKEEIVYTAQWKKKEPISQDVTITIRYFYKDESGKEVELRETDVVSVGKGKYDISQKFSIPVIIKTDDGTYVLKNPDIQAELKGETETDKTIAVEYKAVVVEVTWVDEDGKTLDGPKTFNKGETEPAYEGETPTKAADNDNTYEFKEWARSEADNGNVTYTATYTATPKVTVTWNDGYTDTPLKEEKVARDISDEGLEALYPEQPTRDGYVFDGWADPVRGDDGNIIITAIWQEQTVTPTPTPTPPTPVGPTPITPVGPAATPIAATPALAAAPAAAPAATLVPVADAAVPLANVDADDTRQVNDEDVPLAKGTENEWALLNLLLMIFTILVSVMLLIFYFIGRKEDKDDEYNERLQAASEDETEAKLKRKGLFRLLSIIPAVVAVIFFILTEDMRNPMVFTDKWTLWMAVFALVNVVLAVFAKKKHYDNDDTQKPDYGIA